MKFFVILVAVSMLGACASAPKPKDKSSPKITVTGTRIDRSELPPGPRVSMKVNQENEDSDFLKVFAEMEIDFPKREKRVPNSYIKNLFGEASEREQFTKRNKVSMGINLEYRQILIVCIKCFDGTD